MNDAITEVRRLLERLPPDSEIAQRLRSAGLTAADIRTVDDLARIPILKKEDLPALQLQEGALLRLLPALQGDAGAADTAGPGGAARIFYSPAGIFDFESRHGEHWRSAQAVRAAGIGPGDILLNTFSYHLTPAARMFDESAIAAGAAVVPSGPGQIPMQLDIMRRLGVTGYIGLPSFLNMLIDAALEQGLDWKREFRLAKAIVGAEPISAAARKRFTQFGIEVFTIYGTADLGIIGYECAAHDGWHVDQDLVAQLCEPGNGKPVAEGEIGEVVITLPRPFYPLVRFATGDLSRAQSAPCRCGRPGPRLMGVLGRANQTVKVRGMFVYPAFAQQIAQAHDWIAAARIRVERAGEKDIMRVLVLPRAGADAPADLAAVEKTVRDVTKLRGDVEVVDEAVFRQSDKVVDDVRKWD